MFQTIQSFNSLIAYVQFLEIDQFVQILQLCYTISLDIQIVNIKINRIYRNVQNAKFEKCVQIFNLVDFVLAQIKFLQFRQVSNAFNFANAIVTQLKKFKTRSRLQTLDRGNFVVHQEKSLQLGQI